ncbi:MAG: hypothetical protein WA913_16550, partial [Pricia sp.]
MKKYTVLILVFFALFLSCKQQKEKLAISDANTETKDEQNAETAFFEADPQDVPEREVSVLEIGEKAPDFRLPGTDGKFHSLSDY